MKANSWNLEGVNWELRGFPEGFASLFVKIYEVSRGEILFGSDFP